MGAAGRFAQIGARGMAAALVGEHPLEHQDLFTPAMDVSFELRPGRVAHEAGGARDLVAHPVRHASIDARRRRRRPGDVCRTGNDADLEVVVDVQGRMGSMPGRAVMASLTVRSRTDALVDFANALAVLIAVGESHRNHTGAGTWHDGW